MTIVLLTLHVARGFAATPYVTRVEPPSWWVGHSVNPVRLLFTGANLTAAQLDSPQGLIASNLVVNPSGTHAFCDVFIPSDSFAKSYQIGLATPQGTAYVTFSILPPQKSEHGASGFTTDDTIYLVMPDRFANGDLANDNPAVSPGLLDRRKPRHYHGGDFRGVLKHLGYLKELGVTAIWMTPWYDNVNHLNNREKYTRANHRSQNGDPVTDYHGYGAVDFYAVEERFGDLTDLQALVRTAQERGFKVIQDQVANHTGPYHPWVKQPPTSTWFNGTADDHLDNSWQTWTIAEPNPPADKLKSTLEGWFINILPDLNQNDPETATYLIQNSLWWVGMTGVDAIRQDTLPYVPRDYWSRWTTALKRQHPHLTILGEMFDGKPELVAFFQGGREQFDGVDSGVETLFDFPLHFAMREVFAKGQSMTRLTKVLAADTHYVNARTLVTFLGLHDTARFMSEPGATLEGLQLAFTFLFTVRGTPMIYYGDEIGLNGGGDPYNRADFPGGWPDDPRSAFEPAGRTVDEERIHSHVRKLLALRRELEPLRRGETVPLQSLDQTLALARVTDGSCVIAAFNNSPQSQRLRLSLPPKLALQSQWFDSLAQATAISTERGVLAFDLPPRRAALLTPELPAVARQQGKVQARSDLQ